MVPRTARGLVWNANGCRAQKLPVAPGLLITQEFAHTRSFRDTEKLPSLRT